LTSCTRNLGITNAIIDSERAGSPDVWSHIRDDGAEVFFKPSTNEFVVLGPDPGIIRTYFLPNDSSLYFLSEFLK
jgi:hypothetical protein